MSTVVAQPYSTAGNGGRKLVRLSNGWLVAGVYDSANTKVILYISLDNGDTWNYKWEVVSLAYFALTSNGNTITLIHSFNNDRYLFKTFDAETAPNGVLTGSNAGTYAGSVDKSQTAIGNCSLAIDPSNGHLHACWSSKNGSYPNSFNIRYSKSTDGGVTWSAVEQLTTINVANRVAGNPSIVVDNQGNPIVLFSFNTGNSNDSENGIYVKRYTGTSWTTGILGYRMFSNSYTQSSPSAVVDKDGVIHVAWHGKDSIEPSMTNIRYAFSQDGGITWTSQKITSGNTQNQEYPSITVDKNNDPFVLFNGQISNTHQIRKVKKSSGSWSGVVNITTDSNHKQYPSTLYDPTIIGQFGENPPTIYQNYNTSVEYIGSYTTNQAPTLTLKDSNNQPITQNQIIKHTNKTPFLFSILGSDLDENDNLEYRIVLRNVEYRAWTGIVKGVETEVSIPSEDLLLGNNTIDVFVRDGNGGEASSSFILRNLTPESYSQKHVYDLIVGYM